MFIQNTYKHVRSCVCVLRQELSFCPVPVLIDTGMTAACCRWNHNGSVIAVTGVMQLPGDNKDCNVIQFFTAFGEVHSILILQCRQIQNTRYLHCCQSFLIVNKILIQQFTFRLFAIFDGRTYVNNGNSKRCVLPLTCISAICIR